MDLPLANLPVGLVVPQQVYSTIRQTNFIPLPPIILHSQGKAGLSLFHARNIPDVGSELGLLDSQAIPELSDRAETKAITLRILVRPG